MFKPGDYAFSPGGNFLYEILSHPFCRLYYAPGDKFEFQPHSFERRLPEHKFNYVSYIVRIEAEQVLNLAIKANPETGVEEVHREYEWMEMIGAEFELTDRCLIGQNNGKATTRNRANDADGTTDGVPNVA